MLFSEKSSTGAGVLIRGISSEFTPVPLHTVFLSSDLVTGPVKVGIQRTLPFDGVHLILGNDLAGDKVIVNSIVTKKPSSEKSPDPAEKIIPGLYPACVVMRAMSKKTKTSDEEIALADTLISRVVEDEQSNPSVSEPTEVLLRRAQQISLRRCRPLSSLCDNMRTLKFCCYL